MTEKQLLPLLTLSDTEQQKLLDQKLKVNHPQDFPANVFFVMKATLDGAGRSEWHSLSYDEVHRLLA